MIRATLIDVEEVAYVGRAIMLCSYTENIENTTLIHTSLFIWCAIYE